MRDRLQELLQKAKELEESKEEEHTGEEATDVQQQAVIFETESVIIERHLQEIKKLQNALTDLSENVVKFGQQQKIPVTNMRRISVLKKESDITKDIKVQAESIKKRLDTLSAHIQRAETETGSSSSLTRILKYQHDALFRNFQSIMFGYNDAIVAKQSKSKNFIIRQLEVAGKEVSEEEVDNMVEQGRWDVFSENLLTDVRVTKGQLNEIEQRHKELISLENQMKDLKDMFLDFYVMVEQQGEAINSIEKAVQDTEEYVQKTNEKFKLAVRYKRRNPLKMMCCCCCPCC